MKWALPAVCAASLGVAAWQLGPLFEAPSAQQLEAVGLREVRDPTRERIAAVLATRAPGWGLNLRDHVARAITEESARAGFDPLLVLAVISVESDFQSNAVSVVGARGLMQVRPTTLYFVAEKEGLKLSREEIDADPSLNVRLGVRYLKAMKDQFWGNMDLALMAYNAGPNRLAAALKERNTEPYQSYVFAVRRKYSRLRTLHGQPPDWTFAAR